MGTNVNTKSETQMVKSIERFIAGVARKYAGSMPFEDLMQEGRIAAALAMRSKRGGVEPTTHCMRNVELRLLHLHTRHAAKKENRAIHISDDYVNLESPLLDPEAAYIDAEERAIRARQVEMVLRHRDRVRSKRKVNIRRQAETA